MYKSKGDTHTHTHIYGWLYMIYSRNWHKIVKPLSSNQKEKMLGLILEMLKMAHSQDSHL